MIVIPVERTTGVTVTVGVGIGVAVNVCVGVADCATIGVADCVLVGAKLGFSVAGYVCAAASAASVRPETSGSSVEGLASSIERLASVPDRSVVFTALRARPRSFHPHPALRFAFLLERRRWMQQKVRLQAARSSPS